MANIKINDGIPQSNLEPAHNAMARNALLENLTKRRTQQQNLTTGLQDQEGSSSMLKHSYSKDSVQAAPGHPQGREFRIVRQSNQPANSLHLTDEHNVKYRGNTTKAHGVTPAAHNSGHQRLVQMQSQCMTDPADAHNTHMGYTHQQAWQLQQEELSDDGQQSKGIWTGNQQQDYHQDYQDVYYDEEEEDQGAYYANQHISEFQEYYHQQQRRKKMQSRQSQPLTDDSQTIQFYQVQPQKSKRSKKPPVSGNASKGKQKMLVQDSKLFII